MKRVYNVYIAVNPNHLLAVDRSLKRKCQQLPES